MMGIFGKDQAEVVDVNGRPLRCLIRHHDTFYRRGALRHERVTTFFNLEWTAPTCTCVICSSCGYVHWFMPKE